MVDVSDKQNTSRVAKASARISMNETAFSMLTDNANKKGDVLQVARIAAIMAAKKCADIIPLCHPLMLTKVSVEFELDTANNAVDVTTLVKINGQTGVEMEALQAASVAALTIYDMCKAVDKTMVISDIKVLHKSGGKSGEYNA